MALGILTFLKGLRTHVNKDDVMKDLEVTKRELTDSAIPSVKAVAEQARLSALTSDIAKKFETEFYSAIRYGKKPDNVFLALESVLQSVSANLDELIRVTRDVLEPDTLRDAITARGAHLLRSGSSISFISRYALDLSDYVIRKEVEEASGEGDDIAPAQSTYIMAKLQEFCRLLADYSIPVKDFKKLLEDIPDIYITRDNESSVINMFKRTQLDPFGNSSALSHFTGNPIYHIRMLWLQWEVERYQKAKDMKVILELRLIHLKNLQANSPNPNLEREIEGVQKRIDKYDRKIREVEDSVR